MSTISTLATYSPDDFDIDFEALRAFDAGLNLRQLERSRVPARVMGYGVISTDFAVQDPEGRLGELAFKRLPIFDTAAEIEAYQGIYKRYNRLLEEVGVSVVEHGYAAFARADGPPVFKIIQRQVPAASI